MPDDGDGWEIPDFGVGAPVEVDDADALDYLIAPSAPDAGAAVEIDVLAAESAVSSAAEPTGSEDPELPMFSVTNPAGTVTAIASIAGRLRRVELSAGARMAEAELAQEILLVGGLAEQKARSELYTYLVDQSAEAGQDPSATGRLLRDDVGLPTPAEAAAAQAEAFGAKYLESHG